MNFLSTLEESINLNRMKDYSRVQVLNAFFSNYLAALVMLRFQDIKGLMLINDKTHSKLTSFSNTMSDVNYWGRVLFNSTHHDVKNRLAPGVGEELHDEVKSISLSAIHWMMNLPMISPEQVDWKKAAATLLFLKFKLKYQSSYFNGIVRAIKDWDSLSEGSHKKALGDAFMFLLQSDQESKLVPWFRSNANKVNVTRYRIVKIARINEEDGGGGDGAAVSTASIASNAIVSADVPVTRNQGGVAEPDHDISGLFKLVKMSPYQVTKKGGKGKRNFYNGKVVVKRAKKFNPKMFNAPDFLKPKKNPSEEKKHENEV